MITNHQQFGQFEYMYVRPTIGTDEVRTVLVTVLLEEYFLTWGFHISVWLAKLRLKNKYPCINMRIKNEIARGTGGGGKYLSWITGSPYPIYNGTFRCVYSLHFWLGGYDKFKYMSTTGLQRQPTSNEALNLHVSWTCNVYMYMHKIRVESLFCMPLTNPRLFFNDSTNFRQSEKPPLRFPITLRQECMPSM